LVIAPSRRDTLSVLPTDRPGLLLAPMQDITDLPFMRVVEAFGGPDIYVTEYFRVHIHSNLDPYLLRSITENESGKPIIAQMIGQDERELVRTIHELKKHPIAGVDINLGCPAPVVCRKDAGGGLLRDLPKVDRLLGAMREACGETPFTVKTRVGYHSPDEFDQLLKTFSRHDIAMLTIHGRTVKERYQTPVHPEKITQAVDALSCPVVANGNVVDVTSGLTYLKKSRAAALMIGRGAIRFPWIFSQLRAAFSGENIPQVSNAEVLRYIKLLYQETAREQRNYLASKHVQRMKKFLIFIVQGHPPELEHGIRRVKEEGELFQLCEEFLANDHQIHLKFESLFRLKIIGTDDLSPIQLDLRSLNTLESKNFHMLTLVLPILFHFYRRIQGVNPDR